MSAASIRTLRPVADTAPPAVVLELSQEEARVLAAYLLASSVSAFAAADRAEAALMMDRSDDCRRDAIKLCAIELRLRAAT